MLRPEFVTMKNKINALVQLQADLINKEAEIGAKLKEIERKANAMCESIGAQAQKDADEVRRPLLNALEEYKAKIKAEFGVTDGERINVLQIMKAQMDLLEKVGAA